MKKHRCEIDGEMCEFHGVSSAPDCDDYCQITGRVICNWPHYRQELPPKCPYNMNNGNMAKKLIDGVIGHWDKRPKMILMTLK